MGDLMGFVKAAFGLSGTDRVADRITKEAESRRSEGRDADFWTEYTQREIGFRVNASTARGLISRRIGKSGLSILEVKATGNYGDSVRLLIRIDSSNRS
jgi:hypothetical protein